MKINYNPAAQNTLRHFGMNVDRVDQSMRNLSSGKKVVDGTDGGASLYVTTNMQNKVTGLKQAQTNTETSLSLLQTAEAAMAEGVDILNQMKQLAVHAANEATNDSMLLEADQMEFEELLSAMEQKSERTTFAGKKLLNGSMGISGSVVGNHLRFVEAKIDTPGSPTEGFKIDITQPATRSMMQGPEPLSVSHLTLGFRLVIREGAKVAELDSTKGDLSEELQKIRKSHVDDPERFPEEQVNKEIQQIIIHQLNERFEKQGLPLDAMLSPEGHIKLRHQEFGDHTSFSATSSLPGVLTKKVGEAENSIPGKDVAGSIAGDPASGHGQLLTARPGTTAQGAVTGLFRRTEAGLEPVEALEAGAPGAVVLDQTPFYAESGGQIGDQGELRGSAAVFAVEDTRKAGAQHLHLGTLSGGALALGDRLDAHIDTIRRQAIALNHSATHLLHAALRELLGQHVEQRGSLVTAERLRFDFAHHDAIDRAVLDQIEDRVNAVIWSNSPVQTRVMSFDAARDAGAMALFGEKYGDEVRVLSMAGDFSVELCGGTHVAQTGDIGLLRIVSEQGIASGVRRIEAVTGPAAHAYLRDADVALRSAAGRLKVSREQVLERMEGLLTQQKALERKIDELEQKLAQEAGADLAAGAVEVGGLRVLAATLPSGGAKALLPALDQLKARLAPAAVVLAAVEEGTVSLAAGVSADWAKRLPAGPLVQHVGAQVGAKGGGRPELARAGGGNQPEALEAALASVAAYVAERLS